MDDLELAQPLKAKDAAESGYYDLARRNYTAKPVLDDVKVRFINSHKINFEWFWLT